MNILDNFPQEIKNAILQNAEVDYGTLEEIRLRANKPIILKSVEVETVVPYVVTVEELVNTLQRLCDNSIYTYQNEICNGFVTIQGGHRVGISGEAVVESGKVKNMKYISSLNFRVARQVVDVAHGVIGEVLDVGENSVYSTLVVGPPGSGKTTLLKDIVRQVSNGVARYGFKGVTVGIADERGEIAAMNKGVSGNDLGIRTDVITNLKKSVAIEMLVRSMSPRVVVSDEIGNEDDLQAIKYAICSGVRCIFTAHGENYESLEHNPIFSQMLEQKMFSRLIFLNGKHGMEVKRL